MLGDICVFKTKEKWKIGKVLQFYYPDGKIQKARQCNLTSLNIQAVTKCVAVVCSWYSWHFPLSANTFSICYSQSPHDHSCPLNDYVKETQYCPKSILGIDNAKHQLVCAKLIDEALQSIERPIYIASSKNKVDLTIAVLKTLSIKDGRNMASYYDLASTHKSHLCTGQLLDDICMGATQEHTQISSLHWAVTR